MDKLPPISDEQLNVVNNIKNNNVIVDSVAGSGKTTTNIFISLYYKDKNILLLTYSKRLKNETRDKIKVLNIKNLEVHSYHSFFVKYYNESCYTDESLIEHINCEIKTQIKYDIIILDEVQDMSPLYFEIVCKLISDNTQKDIRICILGDRYQNIFDFKGSDDRFIVHANKIFPGELPWSFCTLSESFRLTKKKCYVY